MRMGLEHSHHRSVINAMGHVLSCLVAYAFRRKWGKSPGGFGDGLHRSVGECQKMAEFRAYRSAGERMLHLRARTFAPLTFRPGKPSISLTNQQIEAYP